MDNRGLVSLQKAPQDNEAHPSYKILCGGLWDAFTRLMKLFLVI